MVPRGCGGQAGASQPGSNGAEAITGLTVDQYGMLYTVAVPLGTFSPTGLPSVVNMRPLTPKNKQTKNSKHDVYLTCYFLYEIGNNICVHILFRKERMNKKLKFGEGK